MPAGGRPSLKIIFCESFIRSANVAGSVRGLKRASWVTLPYMVCLPRIVRPPTFATYPTHNGVVPYRLSPALVVAPVVGSVWSLITSNPFVFCLTRLTPSTLCHFATNQTRFVKCHSLTCFVSLDYSCFFLRLKACSLGLWRHHL